MRRPTEAVCFALQFPLIRPKQIRWELEQLASLVHSGQPRTVLEIGTARGGTFYIWEKLAHPRAILISVDMPDTPMRKLYSTVRPAVLRTFAQPRQKCFALKGNSHSQQMLDGVARILGTQPLDFLFIDGDHSYSGVKRDFEMYSPFVREGGLIAFHDIAEHPPSKGCEVSRFWNEIRRNAQHSEFILDPKQGWAGIGVLWK